MEKFEIQAAKHYYAGKEKTHISVYPIIVAASLMNGQEWECPYKLNLKTAFFNGAGWRWQQIFTGVEEKIPLKTWVDVIKFTELELERLSSIITPLFSDDRYAAWVNYHKINNAETKIIGFEKPKEDDEFDFIEKLIRGIEDTPKNSIDDITEHFEMDNWETSIRTTLEHWMPIWTAWKFFYDKIKEDYKQGKLAEI